MSQSSDRSDWSDIELLAAFVQKDEEAFQELVTGRLPGIRRRLLAECKRRKLPNWDVAEIAEQVVLMAAGKVRSNGLSHDSKGENIFDVCIREKLARLESPNGVPPRRPYDEDTAIVQFDWLPDRLRRVVKAILEDGVSPEQVASRLGVETEEVEEMYYDAHRLLAVFAKYGRE